MNCIVLEGFALYIFLVLIVLMFFINMACLINTIIADKRSCYLSERLEQQQQKANLLLKYVFKLKLIYGDLDVDD